MLRRRKPRYDQQRAKKEEKGDTEFCARSVSSSSALGYTNPMTDEIEIFTSTDKEFHNNLKLAYYRAQ
jgi:hypothetical protein